jgi:hypothetical protein
MEEEAIDVDSEAVVITTANANRSLNRKHERMIRIVNKCNYKVSFLAECKETDSGWRVLNPNDTYAFSFSPKNSGPPTHYWGTVKSATSRMTFPLYSEGAPKDDNLFEIWKDGVYLEGKLTLTQVYTFHVLFFAFLYALTSLN